MLYQPQTNKLSIFGTNSRTPIFGLYNLWTWNISRWDVDGIFPPWRKHDECVVNALQTVSGNIRNIFELGESKNWKGLGPITIKYPYQRRIWDVGFNTTECNIAMFGSAADSPRFPIIEWLGVGVEGECDGCEIDGNSVKLTSASGTWTSEPIEFSPEYIYNFRYAGDIDDDGEVKFLFRTSFDGLNWSDWTNIDANWDCDVAFLGSDNLSLLGVGRVFIPEKTATITISEQFANGNIKFYGTAAGDHFLRYIIEIGAGLSPTEWEPISGWQETKVAWGELGEYDTTSLEDGYYTFKLTVEDTTIGGTQSEVDDVFCYVDNTPPTIDFHNLENGSTIAGLYDFFATINDLFLKEWVFYIDDEIISTGKNSINGIISTVDLVAIGNGIKTLKIFAIDQAGNTAENEIVVTIDNDALSVNHFSYNRSLLRPYWQRDEATDFIIKYRVANGTSIVIDILDSDGVFLENLVTYNDEPFIEDGEFSIDISDILQDSLTKNVCKLRFVLGDGVDSITIHSNDIIVDRRPPFSNWGIGPTSDDGDTLPRFFQITGTIEDEYLSHVILQYKDVESNLWYGDDIITEMYDDVVGYLYVPTLDKIKYRVLVYDIDNNYLILPQTRGQESDEFNITGPPLAEINIGNITFEELANATIDIVDIVSFGANVLIWGAHPDFDANITIKESIGFDADVEIGDVNIINNLLVEPKNYIQVMAKMTRPGSENVSIRGMGFQYSLDWFPVLNNLFIDGIKITQVYSKPLTTLAICPNKETTIYEFIETFRI